MSCSICHQISGHAPDCRDGLAERQGDHEDLRDRVDRLEQKVEQLSASVLDYAHLRKLYAESRDYVGTLERERDDLVEADRRNTAEQNQLDALVERMRPVYEAAKRMRAAIPCSEASEMRDRGFHATTCDLVDEVDRAIAAEGSTPPPYRGNP